MADYPSDAPLPQVSVSRIQAYPFSNFIRIKANSNIVNNETIQEWLGSRGFRTDWIKLTLNIFGPWGFPERMFFDNGVESYGVIDISGIDFGKWVTVSATSIGLYPLGTQVSKEYLFASPIYLFDVYVPFISELPEGVWTDLQFKQEPPEPPDGAVLIAGAVALLILLGVGYAVYRLST